MKKQNIYQSWISFYCLSILFMIYHILVDRIHLFHVTGYQQNTTEILCTAIEKNMLNNGSQMKSKS